MRSETRRIVRGVGQKIKLRQVATITINKLTIVVRLITPLAILRLSVVSKNSAVIFGSNRGSMCKHRATHQRY